MSNVDLNHPIKNVNIDFSKITGKIKIMHAVNNGPILANPLGQSKGNSVFYKAAKIPYARNHDASFYSTYGGEHTVDVNFIFPDFDADPDDPASYDFIMTDKYIADTLSVGTRIFYRLGSKIEHGIKKYNTVMPKDFDKWAVICEHIIRHYNEGWANGFEYNIEYWEIWNEADLSDDGVTNSTWSGTPEDYYRLYKTAATHLKKCFPNLKIGGPALAYRHDDWVEGFFNSITAGERVPMDFFSWHRYGNQPEQLTDDAEYYRTMLDKYGYTETESILNEWNYINSWTVGFVDSIEVIVGIKGAAFTAASMSALQKSPTDMLMYYDARPCAFNGMFDFFSMMPLKGYYPFLMFSKLYDLKNEAESSTDDEKLYVTAATDKNGKCAAMITYYTDDDGELPKLVKINSDKNFTCRLVDRYFMFTEVPFDNETKTMKVFANSVIYIESTE